MANTVQDEIYRSFLEVALQQTAQLSVTGQSLAQLVLQADEVRQDLAKQAAGASATTTRSSASAKSSSGSTNGTAQSSGGESVMSEVLGVFGKGLSPLIKGIFSLFGGGGGDTAAPQPLVKYALPPSISFQAAEVGGTVMSTDYDQAGTARWYGRRVDSLAPGPTPKVADAGTGTTQPATAPAPQITVNVSAMDARSFMDRSSDIAAAVREAMLNLNSINDVVSEL
jgi:hypothetical protein